MYISGANIYEEIGEYYKVETLTACLCNPLQRCSVAVRFMGCKNSKQNFNIYINIFIYILSLFSTF